jgi:type VI secretion system protein ImpI
MNTHITLTVANASRLPHSCAVAHCFDRNGGSIGSQRCSWTLFDLAQGIKPVHCEVRWMENSFCVLDRCGATYLNDADLSIRPGRWVRLGPDDTLRIGDHQLTVRLNTYDQAAGTPVGLQSLEELFSRDRCPLHSLGAPFEAVPAAGVVTGESPDPMAILDAHARLCTTACAVTKVLDTSVRHYGFRASDPGAPWA